MPKSVLVVAPHFPPSALPPSHRARQFATYLPNHGWKPIVLTVDPRYYQEPLEPEILNLLPDDLEVIRTPALRPKWPAGFGIGELGARVLVPNAIAAARICKRRKIDLLYLICPPNHQLLIARFLYARFGIPYLFDYTDPWVSDWARDHSRPYTKFWLAHLLSVALEPIAVSQMSGFTSVSEGTNEGILKRYGHLDPARALALPLGGEPGIFDDVRLNGRECPYPFVEGKHNLLYLGAMWEAAYGTLRAFLRALALVKQRKPALYSHCHIHFVGTTYHPDPDGHFQVLPEAQKAGVADIVSEQPRRLPFLDSVHALMSADALVMMGSNEAHYTASRLLPYLLARRPILAAFHARSDATKLLRKREGARIVEYDEGEPAESRCEQIFSMVVDFLSRPRQPDLSPIQTDPAWDTYMAPHLTGRLAALFDTVIDKGYRSATPG